jgi:hypothetical protein
VGAVADLVQTVLQVFKVDNRQAKAALKDLSDEEKKAAQDALDATEKKNRSLDSQIAKWGKVAAGVGLAVGAYKALTAAAERYSEVSVLETAAVGANIAKIQSSAGGLLTRYQSLTLAAAAQNTQWKLSQTQMEQVAKFMIVLRNRGHDLAEVQNEVTKAIVEGNVEGLKKFGVVIQDVKPGLQAHEALMARIAAENTKAGDNILRAGDDAKKAGVQWKDAIDKLVIALGRIAAALAPIVSKAATLIEATAWAFGLSGPADVGAAREDDARRDAQREHYRKVVDMYGYRFQGMEPGAIAQYGGGREFLEARQILEQMDQFDLVRAQARRRLQNIDQQAVSFLRPAFDRAGEILGWFTPPPVTAQPPKPGKARPEVVFGHEYAGGVAPGGVARLRQGSSLPGALTDPYAAADPGTRLYSSEHLFGKTGLGQYEVQAEPFDLEKVLRQNELLAGSFSNLQSASTAAFEAMISGSESFGAAFKKAMAGVLTAMAAEQFGIAIGSGVKAIVAAAGGDVKGAIGYGIAAGEAAAAAVALGGLARTLGGGGGGGAGRAGLPAGARGSIGAAGGGGSTNRTTIIVTDYDMNPRAATRRMAKAMHRADREHGRSNVLVRA